MKTYTVYSRNFEMRTNGFGYFMGEVTTVHLYTSNKLKARICAWWKKSSWCEGKLSTTAPVAKQIKLGWRLRLARWRLQRAINKLSN